MIDSVIRLSLRYRSIVLVCSLIALVGGSYVATTLPIDVFPDLDRPRVVVITEAPGLATEEVETLVALPLELALMGASGIQDVRSQTTAGLNVLYVEFNWSTQNRAARQTVSERLATLEGVLPSGIRPQMTPPSSIMGQILIAGTFWQRGPNGGMVTPLTQHATVAELVTGDGVNEVHVWRVNNRREPNRWEPLEFELVDLAMVEDDPDLQATAIVKNQEGEQQISWPSEQAAARELRTIADWVIRPRLAKLTGVAEVLMQGGDRKQFQVLLKPSALLEYDVTVQDVVAALRESNINTSGGFAVAGETERPIRILGRLGSGTNQVIDDLRQIPVARYPKRSVLLDQVAQVTEGPALKRGDGSVDGVSAVVLTLVKQPHVDTRVLTQRLSQAMDDIEKSLPPNVVIQSDLFRLSRFINRGVFNVVEAIAVGGLLIIIILFLFLLNVRTTFITLTAIPMSLVITTLVFRITDWFSGMGLTINVMTLGGIAVAMGELVDDAIVDVENIYRRLKVADGRLENENQDQFAMVHHPSAIEIIYEASREVRSAIVFGTAIVILAFLPLFALSGVEGRLFTPLGLAYIVSILASFVVSITVTPVLAYYLLGRSRAKPTEPDGLVLSGMKRFATPLIRCSMRMPGWLLLATWVAVGIAAWQLSRLGRDFLPDFDEGSVLVSVTLPPGSSLQASSEVSNRIDRLFRDMQVTPEQPDGQILHFVRRTGRAEMDEHASPVNYGEYILSMNPDATRQRSAMIRDLRERIANEVPGVSIEVEQPLAHLISHMVSGVYAQIAIKIFGDDLDQLIATGESVRSAIETVPGITPPVIEPIRMTPELHIQLHGEELAYYGITRKYVADTLQTALQGEVVSEVFVGQRRFDLLVRLEEAYRTDYENLGRLRIDLPHIGSRGDGDRRDERGQIELREVATIGEGQGPNSVNRENARRRVVIRCNTEDRDLASAVAAIQNRIDRGVRLPPGYHVEFDGQLESQQNATRMISVLAIFSVAGMFVVLLILFPSVPIVLQLLNAIPTAFIGGVLALVLTGQTLTVASLVGFISLGGIAVRNGVLLVTHYFHLLKEENEDFGEAMILRGSLERLAPVMMTALTAGIGLLPIVLGGQAPGREILYPVATVILGGLITSVICEFLIHPGLFLNFSGRDANRLAKTTEVHSI
ncbi:MAG: efflux RND transporter permease subunit [Planctomycetota bacterium]